MIYLIPRTQAVRPSHQRSHRLVSWLNSSAHRCDLATARMSGPSSYWLTNCVNSMAVILVRVPCAAECVPSAYVVSDHAMFIQRSNCTCRRKKGNYPPIEANAGPGVATGTRRDHPEVVSRLASGLVDAW